MSVLRDEQSQEFDSERGGAPVPDDNDVINNTPSTKVSRPPPPTHLEEPQQNEPDSLRPREDDAISSKPPF